MITKKLKIVCICDSCGKEWLPRENNPVPKVCPFCHNAYWNKK